MSLRSPLYCCIKAHATQSRLECGAASGFDWLAAHKRGFPPALYVERERSRDHPTQAWSHNRLGFAVQLCYLRFPGQAITFEAEPPAELLAYVAQQVGITPNAWIEYAARDETRREYTLELQSVFGYRPFTIAEYHKVRGWLTDLALQTNKALALAEHLIELLRSQRIIVPAITMIDRLCAAALARGVKLLYCCIPGQETTSTRACNAKRALFRDSFDPLNQGPSSVPPKLPRTSKASRSASFNPFCLNSSANTERFTSAIPKSTDFRPMPTGALNIKTSRIAPCFLLIINAKLLSRSSRSLGRSNYNNRAIL
jgi:Domain of unknown function (DUF4158)